MAAKLPQLDVYLQAGIDPKTGLPIKFGTKKVSLKEDTKKFLRLVDEQDAINRFVWYNIPCNITSQELERMLYYKGQLCFFYDKDLDQFMILPYALNGTIDVYGRYNSITPIPFASGTDDKGNKAVAQYLAEKKLKCVYGIKDPEQLKVEDLVEDTVLLHDYSKQLAQTIIPRCQVNDSLLDAMADCVPFMHTGLMLGTGIRGMRISDADQASDVFEANRSMERAALTGEPLVPIVGAVEFQELNNGAPLNSEEYMLAMQSLDNLRLSGYGIDNGGLFEKKAHELQTEADINGGPVGLVLQDGLSIRQNFCNIVNSIWGLGIWCEPAQNVMGMDNDGDGAIYEENSDGANTGAELETESADGGDDYE